MKISKNSVVTLDIIIRDTDEVILEQTDDNGFVYLHGGYDDFFPKVEEALEGKDVGFETRIQLEPEDAFGEHDASLIRVEDKSLFPDTIEVGMMFEGVAEEDDSEEESGYFAVTDIQDDKVVLDGNHPLAGRAIRLSIKVKDVRQATEKELEDGQVQNDDESDDAGESTVH